MRVCECIENTNHHHEAKYLIIDVIHFSLFSYRVVKRSTCFGRINSWKKISTRFFEKKNILNKNCCSVKIFCVIGECFESEIFLKKKCIQKNEEKKCCELKGKVWEFFKKKWEIFCEAKKNHYEKMVVATTEAAANSDRLSSSSSTTTTDHHQKQFSDIYIRTSWIDARIALEQIEKVKSTLMTL